MGLYNRVTGSGNHTQLKGSWPAGKECPTTTERGAASGELKPIELEEAFNGAYRSYRIDGRSRMDVETFFDRIAWALIDSIR